MEVIMSKAIGIDLGTTNSVIAVYEGDSPIIIPNSRGGRLTPSVVSFTKEGEILVGQSAKNQAIINSDRTISSIKRKMGTRYSIEIDDKSYSPEEISAFILRKLKKDAEDYLGYEVKDAVITVPAYFNDSQRQATINAGKIAGINVLRIINEPTAASLAYGLDKDKEQIVMVFDIGGGTYDVSILEIGNGVFQVLATSGNNHLGGDDFDKQLLDYVIKEYKKSEGIDLSKDRMALQRLSEEVEKVKIELSDAPATNLNIPFITATKSGPKHLEMKITRSLFENLIKDIVEQIKEPAEIALKDAKLTKDKIDKVLLVGGSTRIPYIQEKIKEITGKEELHREINPDECVALGAAIQAAIIKGSAKGIVLVDVIPLTLGIEVEGDTFVPIIERNTPIPVSKTKLFTTIADNQKIVDVKIYQGERKIASANKFLGNFQLTGIREAKKGEPRIEVTFEVDVDGILQVSAKDVDTGAKQEIVLKDSTGLSEDEIKEKIENAKMYEEYDKEYLAKMHLLNKADALIIEGNDLLFFFKENKIELEGDLLLDLKDAIEELESIKSKDSLVSSEVKDMVDTVETLLSKVRFEKEKYSDLDNENDKVKKEEKDDDNIDKDDLEILEME